MDTKSLSFKQVCWAQKLFHYYFEIDYDQDKANRAVNVLFWYPQQSVKEEKTLWVENVKIVYCLQLLLAKVSRLSMGYFPSFHQIFICKTTIFL